MEYITLYRYIFFIKETFYGIFKPIQYINRY